MSWDIEHLVSSAVDAFGVEPEFLAPSDGFGGMPITIGLFRRDNELGAMTTAMTFGLSRIALGTGGHSEFVIALPADWRSESWALAHLLHWARSFASGDRAIDRFHTLATEDYPPWLRAASLPRGSSFLRSSAPMRWAEPAQ